MVERRFRGLDRKAAALRYHFFIAARFRFDSFLLLLFPLPRFELTGVTFRDHLHTLSSPIVSPIRAARVDSSRSRMDLVFSLREH